MAKWGGRRAQRWTAQVLATYGDSCWLKLPGCTQLATTGDHIYPRHTHPELQYLVANGRPACLHCNTSRQAESYLQVLARKLAQLGLDESRFFDEPTPGEG